MSYPEFKSMLQIRALRRHHYFRKLKHQTVKLIKLRNTPTFDFNTDEAQMNKQIITELVKTKKVRLIEDKLPYEDLAILENFSEDEKTIEHSRKIEREKSDKLSLKKARMLE